MDFARINPRRDAERGATMQLVSPYDAKEKLTNGGKPIEIDLLGVESLVGRRAVAELVREERRKNKAKKAAGEEDDEDLTEDEILARLNETEAGRAKYLSRLVTGWRGITYLDDDKFDMPDAEPAPLKFSPENAEMLLRTRAWIAEQVDAFLADKKHFLPKSGKK